ncbi:DMT family transporter [Flavimaricola marinus]|uniref:EamA-like transporter family protein n=1 Tax=Flavimaricola marinus TaxID=1819565 RepID=A0A238L8E4_9RHOB|nr:DMT family transporter [Flavimaricola marinus]SMY05977.1 hypothetical protein LOM8899_00098 [Flavimaricola marinus]
MPTDTPIAEPSSDAVADATPAPRTTDLILAFLSGGLLTFMILLNGRLALSGGPVFASWTAHGTGTVAAILFLLVLRTRKPAAAAPGPDTPRLPAPLWAYAGGLVGAVTVMLSSITVNTALALSGTLALGLAGQVAFSVLADRFGLFGLPRRIPDRRDAAAVVLIVAGSLLIIFSGGV